MKIFLPVLLFLCSFSLSAAPIYKHVDEQGNVTYSDKPVDENDQPVELKPVSVIPGRKPRAQPQPVEPATAPAEQKVRYAFEWIKPRPEQTIRNTGGTLVVDLKLRPALPAGHRVELWLDGKKRQDWTGVPVTLQEVWRGEHVLEARLVDANGQVKASDQVKFYMHQASLLISTPIQQGG